MSEASDFVRRVFKEGDDIRDAGLTTPDDIVRFDDIAYGEDPAQQSLDVYRPKEAEGEKLPVIVSVHGGGWVYGDKERYQFYCMQLAQHGFAVVNFTYRLAPENKFPASLEDTNAVFHWLLDHADEYDFDTDHVFAVGDSAGAHNLSLYSCICTNPEYAANYDFAVPEGFAPTAIALNSGAYTISIVADDDSPMATGKLMGDLLPNGGTDDELKLLQVVDYVTPDFPPTFFMTCPGDFLKDDAPNLAATLLANNVNFVFRFYGSPNKPLAHVFHCDVRSEDAVICNDEECAYFKEFCE